MRLLWILLVAVPTAVAAQSTTNFDFRGARLGMSLDEFKSDPTWKKARCRSARLYEGLDEVTVCQLTGAHRLEPFKGTTVISFNFVQSEDRSPRLGLVRILTDIGNATTTVEALSEKFGSEGVGQRGLATNGLGVPIPNATRTWKNSDDSQEVAASAPCSRPDAMCIEYKHLPLLMYQAEQLKTAQRAKSKSF